MSLCHQSDVAVSLCIMSSQTDATLTGLIIAEMTVEMTLGFVLLYIKPFSKWSINKTLLTRNMNEMRWQKEQYFPDYFLNLKFFPIKEVYGERIQK